MFHDSILQHSVIDDRQGPKYSFQFNRVAGSLQLYQRGSGTGVFLGILRNF